MKIKDADIIMVSGYRNSDPDHWQSRWEDKFSTARRVLQEDWLKPVVEDWTQKLLAEIKESSRPVVLVAHSLGCQVVVQTVARHAGEPALEGICGAFLVAPPDVENPSIKPKHLMTFGPYPRQRLPFPSIVVASSSDPFCELDVATEMASAWGAQFLSAGDSGHLNSKSGQGPWPEGLLAFGTFMAGLRAH